MKNPNTIFFIFIFILLTFQFSVLVFSQDSCNSKLNLKSRLPFDATSLNCLPIWSNEDFVLRYGQSKASGNIWSFVLSTPNPKSFVAMGFSTTGRMVGSSAIVGWVESDGTAMMKRYYLGGTSPALVVKDQGNVSLVEGSSSVMVESSRFYMSFQLDMDQPSSRLVFSVGPNGFSPIGPDYRLMEHRNKIATSINYSTGESATEKAPHLKLRRSHGILNMIGWGILMMIGSMIARYGRKWDPAWFYAHATCQVLAFTLGLIGVICGFLLDSRLDVNVSTHKGLGIFILVLGCLQVVAILARPDKASKVRKYWNWYHYIVGRILIIFAISNVFYGIHLGGEGKGWTAAYAVVLSVLFLSSAVFEYKLLTTKN